ncbi:uncharacterized protein EKO05_0000917 [Ascochyta rabiei]|uniref:uncharacterized protein n=1 Tax=Didymella rabiei TaxID=5454 RepID=UPI002203FA6C|nr:uncharacterized protein EKO05_0000917 [Ascochyta rabiei]UPX10250.1 hypothetical protein EKO05_0000917 [Ascochyta rabiei]
MPPLSLLSSLPPAAQGAQLYSPSRLPSPGDWGVSDEDSVVSRLSRPATPASSVAGESTAVSDALGEEEDRSETPSDHNNAGDIVPGRTVRRRAYRARKR